ncbi:LacI family DNA-binding transcriptional regulator [uncultured Cohaesibacter sp.]|uniref:LacI family DNA-binding transcriptional regulator n=1 Tax=uncultured Cohaesibacter sp. TaxID=1002546 RepID=UPI0029C92A55|nr:LacI family DNA-binding transcriptional regulator [uncultured Cohaesibacter sp.]
MSESRIIQTEQETARPKARKSGQGATLSDVASAAGVSISTVSKVLNDKTGVSKNNRQRVLRIVQDLGYRKAEPKSKKAPNIGSVTIVTFDRYAANDLYYVDTMHGIAEEAQRMGWNISLDLALIGDGYTKVNPESLFRRGKPESVIMLGLDQQDLVDAVAALGCPAVIVNGMDPSMRVSSISPDHYFGSYEATQFLLEKGHRRFLHISHIFRHTVAQRIDGMRLALASAGVEFDMQRDFLDTGSANFTSLDASRAIEQRLAEGNFDYTAIVCASDMLAIGATQALVSAGYRVPEDISIVGFDNLPVSAHCEVPLTTMHIDREEMGRMAIKLLAEQATGDLVSNQRVGLTLHMVERKSVAEPPDKKN